VEIFENSSWSCIHGIERWQRDRGCHSGMHPGWHQGWRQPLRDALDWLRDNLALLYQKKTAAWFPDPWAARNGYIEIIENRSSDTIKSFFDKYCFGQVEQQDWTILLRLLEIQRSAMLMYTSCGWFFDELSGLETVQVIQYAGRAIQMAIEIFPDDLETGFLQRLELAKSNICEHGEGRRIYGKFVRPAMVDLLEVGAHYAISSIFEDYGESDSIFCYDICREDYRRTEAGNATLVIGRIRVSSKITYNSGTISFGVLHLGDHNISGGVRYYKGRESYNMMAWEVAEMFAGADFMGTIRSLDKHFGTSTYSLRSLFRDEQRKVLNEVMASSLQEIGRAHQQIYKYHVPLMRFLIELGAPLPKDYLATAELIINLHLRQASEAEEPDLEIISGFLEESRLFPIDIDCQTLEFALRQTLQRLASAFIQEPSVLARLMRLSDVVALAKSLPFAVNLWTVQNICYTLLHRVYPEQKRLAQQGDPDSQVWLEHFISLIIKLDLAIPAG
jgi:hypothetical protein